MVDVGVLKRSIVDAGRAPLDRAFGLPMAAYQSQELWDLEVETLFRPGWQLLGRADQVAKPNSYLSIDVVGEPLLMCRDAQGELHVFSRLCPHRGMELVEGKGQAKTLVCPYHIWSFDLAGRCKHAPLMDGNKAFSLADTSLRPVRFEVWNGFVFVNLDGKAPSLASQIQPLTDMLADYRLEDMTLANTVDWGELEIDWKMMLENSIECYHHIGTHAKSIQSVYPAELTYSEPDTKNFSVNYAISRSEGKELAEGASLADLINSNTNRLITIFPYTRLSVRQVSTSQLQIIPLGPGRIRLKSNIILPRDKATGPEAEAFIEASVKRSQVVVKEDVEMCLRLQKMAASQSLAVGPLSKFEEPVWRFYQYMSETYAPPLATAAAA